MATNTLCQPSNADTNQYLFTTTRVLAAVGFSYLLKALYQLMMWPLLSHRSSLNRPNAVAEENIGLDLDETASVSQASLELDFGSDDDGDLGIRVPERAYHPRGRL
ncbi:hypothetical protein HO133_007018 [Letharia lupina]|uniref:Uncharacterized protein n=1 Tax=Letharia lupina TaxID=560253 RepID=A0A8H6FHY1_9LECA|nr:uncharacterized protein HO133_007018 [Letharia lupina]KAF6228906.1 hypothetical protein HO133_007018 [Letharia lupina]